MAMYKMWQDPLAAVAYLHVWLRNVGRVQIRIAGFDASSGS